MTILFSSNILFKWSLLEKEYRPVRQWNELSFQTEPRNLCPLNHSAITPRPCLFVFFKIYFALLSVWMSFYLYMSVCTLVGMPVESRGGPQMAWSWNYKHLWVSEIELWFSKRVVNNVKCWAIPPSSSFNRFYCLKSVLSILIKFLCLTG